MKSSGVTRLKPIDRTRKLTICNHQPIYDHKTKNWYCKLCGDIIIPRKNSMYEFTEVDDTNLEFNDG